MDISDISARELNTVSSISAVGRNAVTTFLAKIFDVNMSHKLQKVKQIICVTNYWRFYILCDNKMTVIKFSCRKRVRITSCPQMNIEHDGKLILEGTFNKSLFDFFTFSYFTHTFPPTSSRRRCR